MAGLAAQVALAPASAGAAEEGSLRLGGYVESIQGAAFADDLDSLSAANLFQNRLRMHWSPSAVPDLSANLEMRNRLLYGEALRNQPGLRTSLGKDPGWIDLNHLVLDEAGAVLSLSVDRAWAQWGGQDWKLVLGRQRVNWGMALAWNPNDFFNAYNVLDMDYEERPGSDAVRLQVYSFDPLQLDLVAKADGSANEVGALRLGWNLLRYDFQAIGGWYHDRGVAGAGWAGNLWQAGFKGEASWIAPAQGRTDGELAATTTFDYALRDGSFVSGSALFNGEPTGGLDRLLGASNGVEGASPIDLFPSRWTFLVQGSFPVSPILSCGATILFAPDLETVIPMPVLDWNFAEDWELELRGQSVLTYGDPDGRPESGWRSLAHAGSMRIRRSF
ncbi:MAG: hypothetical protein H6686_12580 [Fibrobacteria bacterium]|nr:hypothetical protein [Fibrobacteria bacterium]